MKKVFIVGLVLLTMLCSEAKPRKNSSVYGGSYRTYSSRSSGRSNVSSSYRIGNFTTTTYTNGTTRTTQKFGNQTFYDYSNGTSGTITSFGNRTNYDFYTPKHGKSTNTDVYYFKY